MILVGDIIRFLRLSFTRKELSPEEFVEKGLNMITSKSRIFRQDIAELTSIDFNHLNNTLPFMNGGPAGENWNKSANGFYDWIDSKSCESILGIELVLKQIAMV